MTGFLRKVGYATLFTLAGTSGHVLAQKEGHYPAKPIRMIVAFSPGGGTDIMARLLAQKMSEVLGQSVVTDNRAGGGGTVGAELVVRSAPDGYTLIMGNGSYATNAALYKLPYDPVKDIQAVSLLGTVCVVLLVHPSMPIKNIAEMIAYGKASPGKLNYASSGTGGFSHLVMELLNLMAGTKMTHIPYKGGGAALTDLLGGHVQLYFAGAPAGLPHVTSGRLRIIAVTTEKRVAALPEVPAIGETVPGYEAVHFYGVWGPKGLPNDIVSLWNKAVAKILQTEEMKKRMVDEGFESASGGGPPEQLLNIVRRDVAKWKKVVKEANVTVSN